MKTRRVVVVDHDRATLDLIAELLDSEGFTAACYPEWLASAASIGHAQPDLVILELAHPNPNDTLALLRELRESPATSATPVIVNSTERRLLCDLAEPLRHLGCATLVKPFALDDMLATISACLYVGRAWRS